jgi:hypothetical protein
MTQERLRELLRERVADETMPDYSGRAWLAARGVRRRRRLGAAAGVVVATVGISGGIAALDSTPMRPKPTLVEPATQDAKPDIPDATYQEVPIWWSPDQDEEHLLPAVDSPLPAEIELRQDRNGLRDDDMDRAYAVFEQGRSMTVIGPEGASRYVPLTQLHEVAKPNGYEYFPTPVLSEDGTRVGFAQPDGFALYSVEDRTWQLGETFADPSYAQTPPSPGFDTRDAQQYGPVIDGAATWGMGVPIPVSDDETMLQDPDFLAARGYVLAFMWRADEVSTRYKNCCAVAGWLDRDTVVYESRQGTSLLVSWRAGTHDFGLVSQINGAYDASSFALG